MKKFIIIFISCLLVLASTAKAVEKFTIAEQLSHYIESKQEEQIFLLEKLVNINSGTANIKGIERVGEILSPRFEELGFKVYFAKEPASMKRAGTLIAKREGKLGKRLLLIGHLDTVFPANSSFQHFNRKGNLATGPGVVDDKGGDVVILYALKALKEANALDDVTITVVLTGDEENAGKPTSISRKPLIEAAGNSDIALDFEWAITLDTATIARRGVANWIIETSGSGKHSSAIFKKDAGAGAVYELARILDTMRLELSNEKSLSFSPGLILGGSALDYDKTTAKGTAAGEGNVIAKTALAKGDLRFLTSQQKVEAEKKIAEIVSNNLPKTTATVTFEDGIPAMSPTKANSELLQKYSELSESLGYGKVKALDPALRGAGDISHIAEIVSASLAGLGPVGTNAHSENETLEIDSLTIQTKRAAMLIYSLTHAGN